ncbi:MAG: tetratricopeptide repeat protein [Methyloceanibacter sp.]|uniref:tetratricopeptide repeat protein n=1 Tax=Methyloceanibacter sp. TaxID=1965321 RepID=UPI003D6D6733
MSDHSFFREVDEAVRQDRYKALWDKYGVYILVLAGLIVVGVAAHRGWAYWQEHRAQQAGAEFTQALALEAGADQAKAQEAFAALAENGPAGYRVLARFQLAALEAKAGETEKAVAAYDALAADASVDKILKGLATLQAAALRLDSADYAEMERRLKGLAGDDSAWRFSARELLGLSAYRHNDMRGAEQQFSALLSDQATPPNLRERANVMLALIVGGQPAQGPTTN